MFEIYNDKKKEKFSEYQEFDFENGTKFIFRIVNDEPSLRFVDKDGKDLVDLSEFAPTGTIIKINPDGKWQAGIDEELNKDYIFVGGSENAPGTILAFLHEAGHLSEREHSITASEAVEVYKVEESKDKNNAYPKRRLIAMAKAKKEQIKSERNAWALARYREAIGYKYF